MKLIMENFRHFLNESYKVESVGIVKLNPGDFLKKTAQDLLAGSEVQKSVAKSGGKPLPPERLHITLLHQKARPEGVSGGKWKKALKNLPPFEGTIDLENKVVLKEFGGKKSWLIYVDDSTQAALEEYIKNALMGVGLDESTVEELKQKEVGFLGTQGDYPTRRFHISIANVPSDPNVEFASPGESVA